MRALKFSKVAASERDRSRIRQKSKNKNSELSNGLLYESLLQHYKHTPDNDDYYDNNDNMNGIWYDSRNIDIIYNSTTSSNTNKQ